MKSVQLRSLVGLIVVSISLSSCSSAIDSIIEETRLDFADFDRILADSDTIPSFRLDTAGSRLNIEQDLEMKQQQFNVISALRDSLSDYRTMNTKALISLKISDWELSLENFLSSDSFESSEGNDLRNEMNEFLSENRHLLSDEEQAKLNDLIGKQAAVDVKEGLKEVVKFVNDKGQQATSMMEALLKELNKHK